jgi:hypothetical protein
MMLPCRLKSNVVSAPTREEIRQQRFEPKELGSKLGTAPAPSPPQQEREQDYQDGRHSS